MTKYINILWLNFILFLAFMENFLFFYYFNSTNAYFDRIEILLKEQPKRYEKEIQTKALENK